MQDAITLDTAQAMLEAWMQAELRIAATGQSYEINIGGNRRTLTRANLAEVSAQVKYWRRTVRDMSGSGSRVGYISPKDV